jgi:NADH:ubiquinone oxidoreductase subunit 6 (subunit J)
MMMTVLMMMMMIQQEEEDSDWRMIGALCGGILLLGLCLGLGILYFLKIAKPKKPGTAIRNR